MKSMHTERVHVCTNCLLVWEDAYQAAACCNGVVRIAWMCNECEQRDDEIYADSLYYVDEYDSELATRVAAEACCIEREGDLC